MRRFGVCGRGGTRSGLQADASNSEAIGGNPRMSGDGGKMSAISQVGVRAVFGLFGPDRIRPGRRPRNPNSLASESRFRAFPAIDGRRRMPAAAWLANRFPGSGPRRVRLLANRDDRSLFAGPEKDRNDGRHRHHAPRSSRQGRPRRRSRDSARRDRTPRTPLDPRTSLSPMLSRHRKCRCAARGKARPAEAPDSLRQGARAIRRSLGARPDDG